MEQIPRVSDEKEKLVCYCGRLVYGTIVKTGNGEAICQRCFRELKYSVLVDEQRVIPWPPSR